MLRALRRRWWVVALTAVVAAGGLAAAKWVLPSKYAATTQLLFDPNGFRIFTNDLKLGNYDANAAINFVESQMAVVLSERVLTRVVSAECEHQAAGGLRPRYEFSKYCSKDTATEVSSRSLQLLRQSVFIKRTERSFVVDVTAMAQEPKLAADLSAEVVSAYITEDATERATAAARLTASLSGRLDELRTSLRASESQAEGYRRDKNLVKVGDRLLVEQRLAAATISLNDAQAKLDRATARARQIESASRNPSALGALGAEADTRALVVLIERRNAIMVEMAPLAARAGARHPALIEVRSRLNEVDRSIAAEMTAIRGAARADLSRAAAEYRNLAGTVDDLTKRVSRARQSEIELRTLEQQVDANRKLLESFETRSREANEFGKINASNLRIVSEARAPSVGSRQLAVMMWAVVGFILGSLLGLVFLVIGVLVRHMRKMAGASAKMGTNTASPAHELQLRAQAFARYRVN